MADDPGPLPPPPRRPRAQGSLLALSALAVILAGLVYVPVYLLAPAHPDNLRTFTAADRGWEGYRGALRQEWLGRVGSNTLGAWMVRSERRGKTPQSTRVLLHRQEFQHDVAGWVTAWLLLCNLVWLLSYRERAALPMVVTFAAVLFGYLPGLVTRVYPWDMPALFIFTLGIALLRADRFKALAVLAPLGLLFKETTGLLALLLLLWPQVRWWRRLAWLAASLAACALVKLTVDWATGNPSPLVTMTLRDPAAVSLGVSTKLRLELNLELLGRWHWPHPVLINAGTLVAFLLLPSLDRRLLGLKALALLFCAGNLLCGVITEYRIWFEMIPVSIYGFELFGRQWLVRRGAGTSSGTPVVDALRSTK